MLLEPELEVEIDPQGSSRSRGGHLHGNARGNNFNFADRHGYHVEDLEKLPVTGHVNYLLTHTIISIIESKIFYVVRGVILHH